jgi:hypothetical protein
MYFVIILMPIVVIYGALEGPSELPPYCEVVEDVRDIDGVRCIGDEPVTYADLSEFEEE